MDRGSRAARAPRPHRHWVKEILTKVSSLVIHRARRPPDPTDIASAPLADPCAIARDRGRLSRAPHGIAFRREQRDGHEPGRSSMIEVEAARRAVQDLDALVKSLAELRDAHEQLQLRCEQGEREYGLLRETETNLRRENAELGEALAELRSAYDALLVEYEIRGEAFRKLDEVRGGLLQERNHVADRLQTVCQRLTGAPA